MKALKEADIPTPTPQDLAVRFLSGLNLVIFKELHYQLNNLAHFNIAFPKDLPMAYRLAVNYIPASSQAAERNVFDTSS
jgi:hypothetical protein